MIAPGTGAGSVVMSSGAASAYGQPLRPLGGRKASPSSSQKRRAKTSHSGSESRDASRTPGTFSERSRRRVRAEDEVEEERAAAALLLESKLPQSEQEGLPSKVLILGLILLNAGCMGLAVDVDELPEADYLLVGFLIVFYLELMGRAHMYGFQACAKDIWYWLDFFLALLSTIGFIVGATYRYATAARLLRIFTLQKHCKDRRSLRDVWLVLGGLQDGLPAFLWFLVVLFFIVYPCGGAATVLMRDLQWGGVTLLTTTLQPVPSDLEEVAVEPEYYCVGSEFRSRLECIDLDEYFGSTSRSALSLLQVLTYDRWATSIVRPVLGLDVLGASLLIAFIAVVGFIVMNAAAAVFVYATVQLARTHADHESQKSMLDDYEIVSSLSNFFAVNLKLEDRKSIDFLELKEAMEIPQVAAAFTQLDLPVPEPFKLFKQIDKRNRGHVSVDEFREGLLRLKEPATRVDYARLAARLGGKVTYMDSVEARTEVLRQKLHDTAKALSFAMEQLGSYTESQGVSEWLPEVPLRAAGKMQSAKELTAQKQGNLMYT
mmetsp:Transcript_193/g.633  ORF Transcript_193/g.633 Transcript_193/m.633 type:complete len:546 (-) Transcript_193:64-1701(-)